ncbi:unnamed protein product [Pseudo-nitzschia multistriata]|uniref:DUF6824 domain-containing protein n=1 Tax=Pseudo-nitzschia multistriata TaxID=183589 RepID=A0A448ZFL6_9STRA|nr:unnamed protein product [Pseudo-nitzschia multistriata]
MVIRNGNIPERAPLPPDGLADNPNDVKELLSKFPISATDVSKVKVDDLLSNELLQLSLQDRNAINEEIHGVQNFAPEETPEMLSKALRDMQDEINRTPNKIAYDHSQEFPQTYVNSEGFRLRFLRSDLFEVRKAAKRMLSFLDLLLEIFGDFALRRQIQMSDFNREEMQLFRAGRMQLLPFRDRSGRRIFVSVGGFGIKSSLVTRVKILIYLMLSASEDVETQRKGITSVVWPGTKMPEGDKVNNIKLDRVIFLKRVYDNLPIRTCSLHFCLPDTPFFHMMRTLFVLSMSHYMQRMKFHVGENIELQYCVKGYGIPVELIPLTDTGNIKTTYLKQWIKLRRMIEVVKMTGGNNDDSSSIIECPGSNDVIFRSGTSMSCHGGNVRFRCMIESKHEIPSIVSQTTQAELAEQLIEEIESLGGRFLEWDNRGYWREIDDRLRIHTKVALSIRDFKYKTKARRNQQTNQSYTYLFQGQDGNKRKRVPDPEPRTEISQCRRFE